MGCGENRGKVFGKAPWWGDDNEQQVEKHCLRVIGWNIVGHVFSISPFSPKCTWWSSCACHFSPPLLTYFCTFRDILYICQICTSTVRPLKTSSRCVSLHIILSPVGVGLKTENRKSFNPMYLLQREEKDTILLNTVMPNWSSERYYFSLFCRWLLMWPLF